MPVGLCNAPATFMRLMGGLFGDQNFQSVIYLDDMFGRTFDETVDRLDLVLDRLGQHNLKVKAGKCPLFRHILRHLVYSVWHIETGEGILPNPDAVDNWPTPTSETEMRQFQEVRLISEICSRICKDCRSSTFFARRPEETPTEECQNIANRGMPKHRQPRNAKTSPFSETWDEQGIS